jgi:hypothetical protein
MRLRVHYKANTVGWHEGGPLTPVHRMELLATVGRRDQVLFVLPNSQLATFDLLTTFTTFMIPHKRPKISDQESDYGYGENETSSSGNDLDGESDAESSPDTADEIAEAKRAKSTKTSKRKRRATEPSHFGATLESLLNTNVSSTLPLSLKPSVARKRKDEKLDLKAKKVLQIEKKEKEDKGRITDVIGGWGGASERELRKVAQRGG